ncbi:antitoxin [Vibrio phage 1.236.O._10N.261.52.C4]|nr:antitoxin [Vibrio phage 1.236.O._10N.261.52.C4]
MKLSDSQKKKGYFENPNMSEFRQNMGKYLDLVAKDGWIKIWNRSRPNMILIKESYLIELQEKANSNDNNTTE